MTARYISHLRYGALAMPDMETEAKFFATHWGLNEVHRDGDTVYLSAKGSTEPFSVRLRKADKRIDLIGFGAKSREDVDALHQHLIANNVQIVHEPKELSGFGGGYGLRFFDIDGRTIEVATDYEKKPAVPVAEREPVPVKLSHFVVNTSNLAKTTEFWTDVMGFKVSDSLISERMGDMMHFLRCNEAHHSLAIAQGPHASLHHMSFEMRGVEEWMRGAGKIIRSGTRMVWGPGRHNAGDNTFAYFISPAGNTIEYTTELENITDEENWVVKKLDIAHVTTQDQWGTANLMSEFIARESFNDVDKGLFVAPPA